MDFLSENMGTIFVAVILAIILLAAFLKIRKDKKSGKGCSCGCSGCPSAEFCQSKTIGKDK